MVLLLNTALAFAAPNSSNGIINQYKAINLEIQNLQSLIEKNTLDFEVMRNKYQELKKENRARESRFLKAQAEYLKIKQNSQASVEEKTRAYQEYRTANLLWLQSNDDFDTMEQAQKNLDYTINELIKKQQGKKVASYKCLEEIFHLKMEESIWVEGDAEIVYEFSKAPVSVKNDVVLAAIKKAQEKGLDILSAQIASVPELNLKKEDVLPILQIIIVQQDNSEPYGMIVEIKEGNYLKYKTRVRLLVTAEVMNDPLKGKLNK